MTADSTAASPSEQQLFHTETGAKLHIQACPHIQDVPLHQATAQDRDQRDVCSWCQAELDGHGRTYYPHIEDAMRAFGSLVATKERIREEAAAVVHESTWTPNSSSYIALGHRGRMVMWITKSYVERPGAARIELPGHAPSGGGFVGARSATRTLELCSKCFTTRTASGACNCPE